MPCSTDDRSHRKYYERVTSIETLDSVTTNGNVTTNGVSISGDIETSGYFLGDASMMNNLSYINNIQFIGLEDVILNGNVSTFGAYFGGDLEVGGYFIGNGNGIFNLPWQETLQEVTTQGSVTDINVNFTNGITSFETSGNVVITGNVTCSKLIGSGEFLGGVANIYELSVLSSSISSVENKKIITNTSGLTGVTKGDLLTSTTNGVLGKLSIGSNGQILIADTLPKWETITNIFNIGSRTTNLENEFIFSNTVNLSSLTTGDILYGYGTNDIRRLARETTADNTILTYGDYGTGYGRLLRMDEWGENVMWLHPSNYDTNAGNVPIFTSGTSGTLDYISLNLRTDQSAQGSSERINIPPNTFSVKFNDQMFYSENGHSYSGTGDTKHPSGIKWKLYTYGDIYANYIHGDGSKMVFPQFPIIPGGLQIDTPSGSPELGKSGQLLVFSDKRRKSKIKAMSKSLDTLSKLVPKLYEKEGKRESGFIAQEMYYGVREMRHIVWPDRDATPNDRVPEPNYSDWGKRHACLRYLHFIAYVVKSIQELRERMERLKNNRK
jgi:hypothetical protein